MSDDRDSRLYAQKWFDMILACLLIVGGLILGVDGIFAKKLNLFMRIFFVVIGIAALINMFSRNYYLPFLGDAAFPCGSLMPKVPTGANKEVHVYAPPHSNVIFWAAESASQVQDNPIMAYAANTNAGVAVADSAGRAVLRVRDPTGYFVSGWKKLDPHVHYRVCKGSGMIGDVKTAFLA